MPKLTPDSTRIFIFSPQDHTASDVPTPDILFKTHLCFWHYSLKLDESKTLVIIDFQKIDMALNAAYLQIMKKLAMFMKVR